MKNVFQKIYKKSFSPNQLGYYIFCLSFVMANVKTSLALTVSQLQHPTKLWTITRFVGPVTTIKIFQVV